MIGCFQKRGPWCSWNTAQRGKSASILKTLLRQDDLGDYEFEDVPLENAQSRLWKLWLFISFTKNDQDWKINVQYFISVFGLKTVALEMISQDIANWSNTCKYMGKDEEQWAQKQKPITCKRTAASEVFLLFVYLYICICVFGCGTSRGKKVYSGALTGASEVFLLGRMHVCICVFVYLCLCICVFVFVYLVEERAEKKCNREHWPVRRRCCH